MNHVALRERASSQRSTLWAVTLAALVALALLLPGLGTAPFDDPGEGQHAEIAREAWLSGDWLTLRLNGVRYFDKPPLLYSLAAAAFSLAGPSEWSARLGPLAGAVLAVAATAVLGARLLGPAGGLAAGLALASCPLFIAFARYVRPETLFVAGIQWGFAGLLIGQGDTTRRHRAWLLLGCAALSMAALAKDPLGLVGPLVAVAIARGLSGGLRPVRAWLPPAGILLLIVLGLGWYAVAAARNGGFLWYTVVDNHLLNAARLRHFPDEDVPLSAAEFLAVAGLGAFPWVVGAALMAVTLWRRRAWRDPAEAPWIALSVWSAAVLALFTVIPFKLPHYGLPVYPALALLAVRWWSEEAVTRRRAVAAHVAILVTLAVAAGATASSDGRAFAQVVLSAADVATRKETVAGGPAGALVDWADLVPLVTHAGLVLAVGAAGLALSLLRRAPRLALVALLAAGLALAPAVTAALGLVASGRAVRAMAGEVARRATSATVVVHEGPIEQSGALEFYSGRRPALLDATRSVLGFGSIFPDSAASFWDGPHLRREWLSGQPILLVSPRPPERSVVASLPSSRVRVVFVHNGRWLYASVPPGTPPAK
jgi:4-amino-4-deoxy-L-arabinose transferase-like glycosyltransferase